jgi:SAM-dependent methyltransferase
MKGVGHPTGPLDFRTLDFERLWRGREKTTEVERRLISESVARYDDRRILEVGPGGGRISSVLLAPHREYVGVDVTIEFLVRLRARWGAAGVWLAADLGRLPLASGAFTGAVLVRVYNFLTDPPGAVRELYRVLAPGGWLVVSYFSEPSVAATWDKVRRRLRERPPHGRLIHGPAYPRSAVPTREQFRRTVEATGFRWEGECSAGLEDLRPFRWMPADVFVGLAHAFGETGTLPHHFALLRKPGEPPARLPHLRDIVICPGCGGSVAALGQDEAASSTCSGCGRSVPTVGGVADLRPQPAGRAETGTPATLVRAP